VVAGIFWYRVCSAITAVIAILCQAVLVATPVSGSQASSELVITTDRASNVTSCTARLNGTVVSLGTGTTVSVSFQWGSVDASITTETPPQEMSTPGSFHADVTGLSPSTDYYFIARAIGGAVGGRVESFKTIADIPVEGGAGSIAGSSVIYLSPITNDDGVFIVDATASSDDGNALLAITKGVQAKTANGARLMLVSIKNAGETSPLPSYTTFVAPVYDLGLESATFNPPISLTMTYIPAVLPKGVTEKELVIASWDEASGEWTEIGGTVNPTSRSVKTMINHFSLYTVVARTRPPAISVSELSISSSDVQSGDKVIVTVKVDNQGDLSGRYRVDLLVNDALRETREVEVPGATRTTMTFFVTQDPPGTYTIDVNGLSGTFVIREPDRPPNFVVSDMALSKTQVDVGDIVVVSVLVTNTGDAAGNFTATMTTNGVITGTRDLSLLGKASERIIFSTSENASGEYTVEVSGLSGEFTVLPVAIQAGKRVNWWFVGISVCAVMVISPMAVLTLKRRRRRQCYEPGLDDRQRINTPPSPSVQEIGVDIKWTEIVGHIFRVLNLDRDGTTIDGNGKVVKADRLKPYGYLLVESPILNHTARLPILHRDDFRLVANVCDTTSPAGGIKESELLVTYIPKEKLPGAIPGYTHALHYVLAKKNTLEEYYRIGARTLKPEPERIFSRLTWEGELRVETNSGSEL
jgi:hypothetical protein